MEFIKKEDVEDGYCVMNGIKTTISLEKLRIFFQEIGPIMIDAVKKYEPEYMQELKDFVETQVKVPEMQTEMRAMLK